MAHLSYHRVNAISRLSYFFYLSISCKRKIIYLLNDSLFYLKVESEDIGTLTKIRIGHDNSALVLRGFQTR